MGKLVLINTSQDDLLPNAVTHRISIKSQCGAIEVGDVENFLLIMVRVGGLQMKKL